MGKTFNASVDWLGMVENPDQDVNSVEEAKKGKELQPKHKFDNAMFSNMDVDGLLHMYTMLQADPVVAQQFGVTEGDLLKLEEIYINNNALPRLKFQTGMEMMSNEIPEVEIHSLTKESYDKLSDAQKQVYDSYKGLQYSPFKLSDKSEGSLHYLDALDMVEGSQVGNIFNEPHINAPKGIKMDEHGLFRAHAYPNPFSYATQGGLISNYISSGDIHIPSIMTYDRQSKTFLKKKYGTDDSRKIYMNKLIAELAHVDPDVRQTILEQVMTEGDRLRRAYNQSYLPHLDLPTKIMTIPHIVQNFDQYKKAFWPDKSNYSSYGDYEYHTHYGPESAERALIEKYSKQPYSGITTEGTFKHLPKRQRGFEILSDASTRYELGLPPKYSTEETENFVRYANKPISHVLDILGTPGNIMAEIAEGAFNYGDQEFNFSDAMPGFSGDYSFTNMYGEPTKTVSGVSGVKGFWPGLALDIVTDPTTYIGAGLLKSGVKGAIKGGARKTGEKIARNLSFDDIMKLPDDKFKTITGSGKDYWKMVIKKDPKYKQKLLNYYNNMWEPSDKILDMINKTKSEFSAFYKSPAYKQRLMDGMKISSKDADAIIDDLVKEMDNATVRFNNSPLPSDGIAMGASGSPTGSVTFTDKMLKMSDDQMKDLIRHEFGHVSLYGGARGPAGKILNSLDTPKVQKSTTQTWNQSDKGKKLLTYHNTPDEVRQRAMNALSYMQKNKLSVDEFMDIPYDRIVNNVRSGKMSQDILDLRQYFDPKDMKNYLEKAFSITAPIGVGSTMFETEKYQQGRELLSNMLFNPDGSLMPQLETKPYVLEPRTDKEVMDPKLLPPAEYQKRISDHHNKFRSVYQTGTRKYPEADASWGEGWDDRWPDYSYTYTPTGKVYKTPHHSSGLTMPSSNCIHGVCYYALDAGVESLGKYGDGQYQSNAEFFDKYGDNEGFVIDHNPFDGRTYGPDFIYAGDMIQLLTQPGDRHERSDVTLGDYRPRHAYMVVDAGNPTHTAENRIITLGHNSGSDVWITEKYSLKDVLTNLSEKLWVLNAYDPEQVVANKNLEEKDRLALTGQHKYAKDYLTRDPAEIEFRFPGYGSGGTDNELLADNRFLQKRKNVRNPFYYGLDSYSDGTKIDYLGTEWIIETYKDYYTTLGKVADMPTDVLDKLMLNQIGIRVQESSKNPTKYKVSNIAKSFPGKTAKRAYDWLFGDDGTWEEDYWAKNVKNVQDKYHSIDIWKEDMYKRNNKSKRIFAIEADEAPLSRGPFQQKALSTRGREILKFLTGKEDVNFKDDVLGGPKSTKSARDNQQSREVLASLALAMDNFHMLKRHHKKIGTKINGEPLTNDMLIALATLAHNAPNKAMTKEYVEYYFDNYWKGKKNKDGGIAYLDNIDLYKGYLINENNNKTLDPLRTRNKTAGGSDATNSGRLNVMQDGGSISPREKYIQFALDTESGHDYIRAKDSAVKKLDADGKWDGKSYYKIFEDGKYYPHYVGDEKRATIGHGHNPVDRDIFDEYKGGITEDEALKLLDKDIDEKLRLSEIYYNQRFGDDTWNQLTDDEKYMLNDYTFNVRGGFRKTFKKFAKAIHDKDYELAEKEYKRALGERNKIFMDRYLKPWIDIQKEKTTVAPPLEDMPLPIGTFPTDSEGNPQSMSTNPNEPKKETSWWRGEEGWIPDELELPWFMDGAGINSRGNTPSSVTDIPATADGSRAENATMSRSAMDPMPSLNNDLTVNDNLALDNTIADLSEETNIPQVKYGGQYMWGLDLRSTKAQAGKEVRSDDIYSNDRYSQSATKYKRMLPKYRKGYGEKIK